MTGPVPGGVRELRLSRMVSSAICVQVTVRLAFKLFSIAIDVNGRVMLLMCASPVDRD